MLYIICLCTEKVHLYFTGVKQIFRI